MMPTTGATACLRRLALSYLNADLMMQLTEYHFDKATAVRRPLILNLAAAALRMVSRVLVHSVIWFQTHEQGVLEWRQCRVWAERWVIFSCH